MVLSSCTHPEHCRRLVVERISCSSDYPRSVEEIKKTVCTACSSTISVVVHYPEHW